MFEAEGTFTAESFHILTVVPGSRCVDKVYNVYETTEYSI
jgi:hypothetical protein